MVEANEIETFVQSSQTRKILENFRKFQEILRNPRKSQKILENSRKFQEIQEILRKFQELLENPIKFQEILGNFRQPQKIVENPGKSQDFFQYGYSNKLLLKKMRLLKNTVYLISLFFAFKGIVRFQKLCPKINSQSFLEYFRMFENVVGFPSIFQNFPEFSRIFQNFPEFSLIFLDFPRFFQIFLKFFRLKIYGNIYELILSLLSNCFINFLPIFLSFFINFLSILNIQEYQQRYQ